MASSDYNVADRTPDSGDKAFPVTAADKLSVTTQVNPDSDARAAALAASVSNAAFIGYAAALAAYEARADIETLADRRARTNATADSAQDFMRRQVYNNDGTIFTGATVKSPPRPGDVYGDADKSA
jgi:hypothetical protein